ncbi:MAG: cupin domain-containing protein [Chitinophagaceae bacterium]|nr:cupin domain-containing protein [Chitinophagaceae bacterium]
MEQQNRKARRTFINPIYNDRVTVLKSCDETSGEYSLGELEVYPGGGNGLHTHSAFEETFTSVKGTLGVRLRDKNIFLNPGESVTVPRHTPHHFFNSTAEPVICTVQFKPGHDGFEKGLAIAYGLASDGETDKKGTPKRFSHLALLIKLTDTRPAGFVSLLMPVFNWLANRAKRNGTENALLNKYYYE